MNRLVLVDDEPDIVDGLYEVFCRESGLELDVYKAYSGIEAIEKMKNLRFDIVVTDIKMPGITGLQLLDTIYSYWPKCKVIMLTGYSEFDYVYATIHKPGAKYILKTEGDAAIIEAVRECVEENRKEHEREAIIAVPGTNLPNHCRSYAINYLPAFWKEIFQRDGINSSMSWKQA